MLSTISNHAPFLSSNAWQSFHDSSVGVGYVTTSIVPTYNISGNQSRLRPIDAVAFANPPSRISAEYASITLYNLGWDERVDQIIPELSLSSAPFHFIHHDDKFDFYMAQLENYGRQSQVRGILVQNDITYEQLPNLFSRYARDFKPETVLRVKRGLGQFESPIFHQPEPLQLSLFVQNVNEKKLVEYFSAAVNILRINGIEEQDLALVATQLLGVAILVDTGEFGETSRLRRGLGLSELYRMASAKFPSYFQYSHSVSRFEHAFGILREGSYATFQPDMLTALYTAAHDQEQRRALGRYDTPLYLTRRMWENIPVEFISPENRIVLDMTCGWGSFLIAGYDRLSKLSDASFGALPDQIHGNDKDPFTASLAKLGLLLHTSQDKWEIQNKDALNTQSFAAIHPHIIVGNPPFSGNRKTGSVKMSPTETDPVEKAVRHQKADAFLKKALDYLPDGGYLAMLMPLSFVGAESAPLLRKRILNELDVYELWELPSGVFKDANADVIAIFAHKQVNQKSVFPVRVRSIQNSTSKSAFRLPHGSFSVSTLADPKKWNENSRVSTNNTHVIDYRTILAPHEWAKISEASISLHEVADFMLGVIEGQNSSRKRHLSDLVSEEAKWPSYPTPDQEKVKSGEEGQDLKLNNGRGNRSQVGTSSNRGGRRGQQERTDRLQKAVQKEQ